MDCTSVRGQDAKEAALAAAAGARYLQADALPSSRPILARLGFIQLAVTTPFTRPGAAGRLCRQGPMAGYGVSGDGMLLVITSST